METFRIHIVNQHFSDSEEVALPDIEAARKQGLKGALQIGAEEISNGSSFFGAEIRLESDGKVHERFMVAIGSSGLQKSPQSGGVIPFPRKGT